MKKNPAKKSNHIAVYVTDAERKELEKSARVDRVSLCEWVRRKIWRGNK